MKGSMSNNLKRPLMFIDSFAWPKFKKCAIGGQLKVMTGYLNLETSYLYTQVAVYFIEIEAFCESLIHIQCII